MVVAGRQQPPLARLRGFGFVVNLEAVRQADLGAEEDDDDADAPLGGAALRSCIEGGGEPPRELLLAAVACAASVAAVACAASGTVRGVPVQWLREDDAIETLYLDDSGIGATSVALLCLMLPAVTSVRSLRCPSDNALRQRSQPAFTPPRRPAFLSVPIDTLALPPIPAPPLACSLRWNWIGEEGTSALAAILKETQITNLKCAAARAFVSMPVDTPTLTVPILPLARSLEDNRLGDNGATALAAILNETKITHLRCAAIPVAFAFVSAPIDTTQLPPPFPCSQSATKRPRSRRRSCSRGRPQG